MKSLTNIRRKHADAGGSGGGGGGGGAEQGGLWVGAPRSRGNQVTTGQSDVCYHGSSYTDVHFLEKHEKQE